MFPDSTVSNNSFKNDCCVHRVVHIEFKKIFT